MTKLDQVLSEFESKGGEFTLTENQVNVVYPLDHREALAPILATLRANRQTVEEIVRERLAGVPACPDCPALPPGVRLVRYAPKAPPVAVQPCSIVTDVDKFIRRYLEDLRFRLENPKVYACAPLDEILAKLAEVGVELVLGSVGAT